MQAGHNLQELISVSGVLMMKAGNDEHIAGKNNQTVWLSGMIIQLLFFLIVVAMTYINLKNDGLGLCY